jgi:Acetyltransferase (GNAT) domain
LTTVATPEIIPATEVAQSTTIGVGVSESNDTAKALSFHNLFTAAPADTMIGNLSTALGLHDVGDTTLPTTTNSDLFRPTCYLCCPSVAYIDYAREELRHFAGFPALSHLLDSLLRLGYPLIRAAQFDRQVQVNNWLFATNPIPDVTVDALASATRDIARANPGHIVIWRSLNDYGDRNAIDVFRQAGYEMYPARQIYLFDCRNAQPKRHRDERRDGDLLSTGAFRFVPATEFSDDDDARARMLYQHLYLEKYTWLNPQYTASFMTSMRAGGILEFQGLRGPDGQLSGVIAFFDSGRTMTAPIVGYDSTLPQETGLYRMLMALALKRARERNMLFNMSAGAASFKRNRGGVGAIEYSAVYNNGLAPTPRMAALLVRKILEWVGIPMLRSFEL